MIISFETFFSTIADEWSIYEANMGKPFFPRRTYVEWIEHRLYASEVARITLITGNKPSPDALAEKDKIIEAKRTAQEGAQNECVAALAKLVMVQDLQAMWNADYLTDVAKNAIWQLTGELLVVAQNAIITARSILDDPSDLPF